MRIFMTGATGILGGRVVPALIAKGHSVVGLSRSEKSTEWLTGHGAEPRAADLFDADQMSQRSADCDAILHLATAIPTKPWTTIADWATNDRIRREGTHALIEAALGNKCSLFLQQSVTFPYMETETAIGWMKAQPSHQTNPRFLRPRMTWNK